MGRDNDCTGDLGPSPNAIAVCIMGWSFSRKALDGQKSLEFDFMVIFAPFTI